MRICGLRPANPHWLALQILATQARLEPGAVGGGDFVSYRSFKHLLGETSLERKCRFIFGAGILLLVTTSFYWYGQKTESLVVEQTTAQARMVVDKTIYKLHVKALGNQNFASMIEVLSDDFSAVEGSAKHDAYIINPNAREVRGSSADLEPRPQIGKYEMDALTQFLKAADAQEAFRKTGNAKNKPYTFANGTSMWVAQVLKGKGKYQYVQAVLYKPNCLMECHSSEGGSDLPINNHVMRQTPNGKSVVVKAGDLAGVVVVNLDMDQLNRAIARNRAILITAALVTAIMAMIASYVIVRYVIVKPVKHLRDVSDAIAAGKLTVRSQIQTGDEFEELSHAFNRMLVFALLQIAKVAERVFRVGTHRGETLCGTDFHVFGFVFLEQLRERRYGLFRVCAAFPVGNCSCFANAGVFVVECFRDVRNRRFAVRRHDRAEFAEFFERFDFLLRVLGVLQLFVELFRIFFLVRRIDPVGPDDGERAECKQTDRQNFHNATHRHGRNSFEDGVAAVNLTR